MTFGKNVSDPTLKSELQLPFQNKYAALAEFPKLPPPMLTRLVDLKTNKPFDKGQSSSSSVQSKQSYTMKAPETFAQAVDPTTGKTTTTTPPIKEEFKFVTTQITCIP
ncbi:uncharacterized protein LOC124894837 [Capsicum annuum]|uniref:uncharacterized protein LOC124894837 n=1 Tax=Capsicum annuum TaxID=4072 RepID=UPI001FB15084|nr:uncharacterized protein LOC124894837 [Capsicum annuum]